MELKSVYDWMGLEKAVAVLVDAFNRRVLAHPTLRTLFPDDIRLVRDKQYQLLTQFFGGPPLYTEAHEHPML